MNKKPSCLGIGCGFFIVMFIVSAFMVPRDSSGKIIEETKTAEQIKQEKIKQAEVNKRLSTIKKIANESGYSMEVDRYAIRITVPGAISEYEAQRIAKTISDRTGTTHVVRVYDNAGLLRARL